jgi:hypothetical protein
MGEHQHDSALPLVVVQSSCCIGRGEVHAKIEKGKAALNPLGHQPLQSKGLAPANKRPLPPLRLFLLVQRGIEL